VGSRAYCGVGIVLATFAVTSANRRWLDGAVPAQYALAAGCGLSTALAAWVRDRLEDRSYENYVFGGLALTVVLLMHAALPISELAEAQRWYYAVAMLAVAALYLAVATARVRTNHADAGTRDCARTAFLWGHLCTAASAALALLPMASGHATPLGAVAVVAVAGGVYVICASLLREGSLGYAGGGVLALAGMLALDSTGWASEWSAWGVMLTVLGIVAASLMLAESRARSVAGPADAAEPVLTTAYGRMSLTAFACAGGCLGFGVLQDVSEGRSIVGPGWARTAVPAAICAGAYAVAAFRARVPEALYAAAVMLALALGMTVDRLLAPWPAPGAYRFCHDLAPMAALVLAAALRMRPRGALQSDEDHIRWTRPHVTALLVTGALALVTAGVAANELGVTSAFWLAVGLHTAFLLAGAWLTARWPSVDMPQSLATTALAGVALMVGWGTWSACRGPVEVSGRYAGTALLGFGLTCVAAAVAGVAASTSAPSPSPREGEVGWLWALPLRVVGPVALGTGAAVLLACRWQTSYAPPALYEAALLCGVAVALAVVSIASRRADDVSLICSVALLGTIALASDPWDMPARPQALALVLGAGLCAAGYWVAAWRRTPAIGWLAALTGSFAWLGFTQWLLRIPEVWWCLAQAPWLLALYAYGDRLRTDCDAEVGQPARMTAVTLAIAMLVVGMTHGAVVVSAAGAMSVTLVVYSALFAIRIWYRPSAHWTALATGGAVVAVGYHLGSAGWPAQSWAAALALAAGAAVVAGRLLELADRTRDCAAGAYAVGGLAALIALVAALTVVSSPGAGETSVLAIALAGTVWAALFTLGRGAVFAHAG